MSSPRFGRLRGWLRRRGVAVCAALAVAAGVALVAELRVPGLEHVMSIDSTAELWMPSSPTAASVDSRSVLRVAVIELGENGPTLTRSRSRSYVAAPTDPWYGTKSRAGLAGGPDAPFYLVRRPVAAARGGELPSALQDGTHWVAFADPIWFPSEPSAGEVPLPTSHVSYLCRHPSAPLGRDAIVLSRRSAVGEGQPWSLDHWRDAIRSDAEVLLHSALATRESTDMGVVFTAVERVCTMAPVAQSLGVEGLADVAVAMHGRVVDYEVHWGWDEARGKRLAGLDAVTRLMSNRGGPAASTAQALLAASEELRARPWPLLRVALGTADDELARSISGAVTVRSQGQRSSDSFNSAVERFRRVSRGVHGPGDSERNDADAWRTDRYPFDLSTWRWALAALSVLTAVIAGGRRTSTSARLVAVGVAAALACAVWDPGTASLDPTTAHLRVVGVAAAALGAWWLRRPGAAVLFVLSALANVLVPEDWSLGGALRSALTFAAVASLFPWRATIGAAVAEAPRRPARARYAQIAATAAAALVLLRHVPCDGLVPPVGGPAWLPGYGCEWLDFLPSVDSSPEWDLSAAENAFPAYVTVRTPNVTMVRLHYTPLLQPWHAVGTLVVTFVAVTCAACARRGAAVGPLARVLLVWLVALHAAALFLASVPAEWHHRLEEFAIGGAVGSAVLTGLAAAAAARFRSLSARDAA